MSTLQNAFDRIKNTSGSPEEVEFDAPETEEDLALFLSGIEEHPIDQFILKVALKFGQGIRKVIIDAEVVSQIKAAIEAQIDEPSKTQAIHERLSELSSSGALLEPDFLKLRKSPNFVDLSKQEAEYMLYSHHRDKLTGVRGQLDRLLITLRKFAENQIDLAQLFANWGLEQEGEN